MICASFELPGCPWPERGLALPRSVDKLVLHTSSPPLRLAWTLPLLIACSGNITDPGAQRQQTAPETTIFDPTQLEPVSAPEDSHLRRLSNLQLENAIAESHALLSDDALTDEVSRALVRSQWADGITERNVTSPNYDALRTVAVGIAEQVTSTPEAFQRASGCDSPSATCIDTFLATRGQRILRRPLTDEERAYYRELGVGAEATYSTFATMVAALFLSPHFLFHTEHTESDESGAARLQQVELASRLSFFLWRAPADDELWELALAGGLDDAAVFAQAERLLDDPRSHAFFRRLVEEWLAFDLTRTDFAFANANTDPRFVTLNSEVGVDDTFADAMMDELADYVRGTLLREGATLRDLFSNEVSYAQDARIAALYGVPTWDGSSAPPATEPRSGLLGRVALLATASSASHPVLRGVRIQEHILCDPLGSPPANTGAPDNSNEGPVTTRERWAAFTSGGGCIGCHSKINELGFVFEGFGSLGEARTQEPWFDESGGVQEWLSVSSAATPKVGAETIEVSGPTELAEYIAGTGRAEACFAQSFVSFALDRETLLAEPAVLDFARTLREGTFREALAELLATTAFLQREVAP